MDFERYLTMVTPWFDKVLAGKGIDYRRLAELMQSRTEVFNRVPDMVRFLAELPDYDLELYTHKKMKSNPQVAMQSLQLCRPVLEAVSDWTEQNIPSSGTLRSPTSGMCCGSALRLLMP